MSPDQNELDDEIRGHMALSVKERIERGEDPEAARLAALREFGNVTLTRDSMRAVWQPHWFEAAWALWHDIRIAWRSLTRAKGLAATVVVTLALGIGANAAIFSVVRGVLLRPLVNRDEDRLIYIRQSAPGIGAENSTFSVPEVEDLRARIKTINAFRRVLHGRFRNDRPGRRAPHGKGGRGRRIVLRRDGSSPRAGPPSQRARRWPQGGRRGRPHVPVLDRFAQQRSGGRRKENPARSAQRDRGRRAGAIGPVSRRHRDHRQHRHQPASPQCDDGEGAHSPHDRAVRRLAPGVSLEEARAEFTAVHAAIKREHPEAYSAKGNAQVRLTKLRDQIAAPARTILLVLLAAAAVVFVIACSNVANLILARSVRREGELAVRAALGAGYGALRRTLLAESLVLCGAGAMLGLLLARPFVAAVALYAGRFSVRALEVTVDPSVLWIGAGLAMAAAVLLAYVPRLPSPHAPAGLGLANGSTRITPATNRRLRVFATTQIAFSFVLLSGAAMLLATLVSLQTTNTGYNMRQVLVFDIPAPATGVFGSQTVDFYQEATRRVSLLPGVEGAAVGAFVPWRDAGTFGAGVQFTVDGYKAADGEENPRARFRIASPRFFAVLGVPILEGRDFTDEDRAGSELVSIISQSVAQRLFPNGEAVNRRLWWLDPYFGKPVSAAHRRRSGRRRRRERDGWTGPHGLSARATDGCRRAAVRAGGRRSVCAGAGGDAHDSRAFTGSTGGARRDAGGRARAGAVARTPERVRRLRIRRHRAADRRRRGCGRPCILRERADTRVRRAAGGRGRTATSAHARALGGRADCGHRHRGGRRSGYALARAAVGFFDQVQLPGVWPVAAAAAVLIAAAVVASLMPATRASRVDVLQALRSE